MTAGTEKGRIPTKAIDSTDTVTEEFQSGDSGVSYADHDVVIVHYPEVGAELRKAIGIPKERRSGFERTLREFRMPQLGIGGLGGVLSGGPEFVEQDSPGQSHRSEG